MPRIADALTGVFVADSARELNKWTAAVERDDTQLAEKREELARTNAALADAVADDPIDDPLIVALRAKRQQLAADIEELAEVRARHMASRDDAQRAENERVYGKELAAEREINRGKVRAARNHADEFARQLKRLPALLSQVHEVLEQADAAAQRAELVTGAAGSLQTALLAGHAVQQANLERGCATSAAPWTGSDEHGFFHRT
jgi:hypothetical protein